MLASLGLVLLGVYHSTASPLTIRQSPSLIDCLASLSPVTSSSAEYSSLSAAYNQRIQPQPTAFVTPSTQDEVAQAINCATAAGLPVAARSGGHSYASFGLGGPDQNSLIIDLRNFQGVQVFNETSTATIGAGMRLGDIALALNAQGKGLPHGTCPFVGIGGHAGFGGFGLSARLWGLTVDQVIAFNVVLGNGTALENVTQQSQPDLFWALAGAAPNYGVVTQFTVKVYDAPASNVRFHYKYDNIDPNTAADAFLAYQSFGNTSAPAELGLQFTTLPGISCDLSGVFYGTESDFEERIGALETSLPAGFEKSVQVTNWIEGLQILAGSQNLNTSGVANSRDTFFAKSLMTPGDKPLTKQALLALFNYLKNTQTNTNWFVQSDVYGGANSAINSISTNQNSFAHRNSLLSFQLYASSPNYGLPYPDDGVIYVQKMYAELVNPMQDIWQGSEGMYINYVDPTLSADEIKNLYWGQQYSRLAQLKQTFDPNNLFRNPQSIVAAQLAVNSTEPVVAPEITARPVSSGNQVFPTISLFIAIFSSLLVVV